MKLYFMINPISGSGRGKKAMPKIKKFCIDKKLLHEIFVSKYPKHIEETVRNIIKETPSKDIAFIAVGGDGTVLEVLNGMYGHYNIPLGVIPVGTGNDFSRSIGLEPRNIERSLDVIFYKNFKSIDLCDLTTSSEKREFLNVSSIGFDADVNKMTEKLKSMFGNHNLYALAVIICMFTYKPKRICIETNGEIINKEIMLCAIANGNYYASGFLVNPNGKIDDGKFDLIIMDKVPNYKVPFIIYKYYKGRHLNFSYVSTLKADSVKITSQTPMHVQVDGESVGDAPMSAKVIKGAVTVFSPE